MAATREQVLRLYRQLMREGNKFKDYNFRLYAIRRIKDAFREHRSESDPTKIEGLLKVGSENLDLIKRQVLIGHLYSAPELIIEKKTKTVET